MDQGQIKEVGRHEELLENSVLYRRLYDLQFNQTQANGAPKPDEPFNVIKTPALAR